MLLTATINVADLMQLTSFDDNCSSSDLDDNIPDESKYYKRQRKAAEAWAGIREQLLYSAVTSIPLYNGVICILCKYSKQSCSADNVVARDVSVNSVLWTYIQNAIYSTLQLFRRY